MKQPISQHPLFPAIVALWFGALFGLGSLTIRPVIIERLVVAAGIDRVIPMAAPPLGNTARILIALGMIGIGALIGLVVARRMARPTGEASTRRRAAVPVIADETPEVEVLPETADVIAEEPAAPVQAFGRRRTLRPASEVEAEPRASEDALEPRILDVAEFDIATFDEADTPPPAILAGPVTASELEELHIGAASVIDHGAELEWIEPLAAQDERQIRAASLPASGNRLFDSYARDITPRGDASPLAAAEDAARDGPAPGFQLLPRFHGPDPHAADEGELVFSPAAAAAFQLHEDETPFAVAEAIAAHRDEEGVDDAGFVTAAAAHFDVPDFDASAPESAPMDERGEADRRSAAERIAAADLDDLSPVELLERLALAMARRRDRAGLAAAAPVIADEAEASTKGPVAPVLPRFKPFEVHAGEPATTVLAHPGIPAALRPIPFDAFDDHADADDAVPGYVPPRHIGLAPSTVLPAIDDEPADGIPGSVPAADQSVDDDITMDRGYSSLLNLSRSSTADTAPNLGPNPGTNPGTSPGAPSSEDDIQRRAPFARPVLNPTIDAAPDAAPDGARADRPRPFDAPGKAGGQDPEGALRTALAALQRMSGAA